MYSISITIARGCGERRGSLMSIEEGFTVRSDVDMNEGKVKDGVTSI